ncbi:hypothetical protein LBMAG21_09730 [Armatimonadota bacterium]|nr:hypothetical protein [Armatimonadota bacterium]GDX40681.1 hypothetical protein LBMAG21_09730 [Armatimonadota bacterium]
MTETTTHVNLAQSAFCRELRSKKYYFLQGVPTVEKDILDGSNHCWCRLTAQAIGPDGELVQPADCSASRDCYRSLFDENE